MDLDQPFQIPAQFKHLQPSFLYNPQATNFVNKFYSVSESQTNIGHFEDIRHQVIDEHPDHYQLFMETLMLGLDKGTCNPREVHAMFLNALGRTRTSPQAHVTD